MFCSVDILAGWLLYKLAVQSARKKVLAKSEEIPSTDALKQEWDKELSNCKFGVALFWLFNPLVAIISARSDRLSPSP